MATHSAQVTARQRTELGSRANKRLRDSGFVPGVVYGHKEAVIPVTLPRKELTGHLEHGTHLFDLALVQDHNPIGHGHRLNLIVGDVDDRNPRFIV